MKLPYSEWYKNHKIFIERIPGVGFKSLVYPMEPNQSQITIEERIWTKNDLISVFREKMVNCIVLDCKLQIDNKLCSALVSADVKPIGNET